MTIRSVRVSHIVLTTKDIAELLLENLRSCGDRDLMLKMFARLAKKSVRVEPAKRAVT